VATASRALLDDEPLMLATGSSGHTSCVTDTRIDAVGGCSMTVFSCRVELQFELT